jgi:hypothetical protein
VFVVCATLARCKMARPVEVLFYHANARCKMAHPAEKKSIRRAATV